VVGGYEREYAAGTPAWVDLASPDMVVSARFYGGLFDWDTARRGPVELTGGYLTFQVQGRDVAGIAPLAGDAIPAWTSYMVVRDADEVEAAVVSNGGATLEAPSDVLDLGRTALLADPTGAVFAIWQPQEYQGADLLGTTGALCWTQLASRNIEAAKRFYNAVFGWQGFTTPYETSTYTRFHLDGCEVAGMIEMDRSWPRDLPSHWMAYFAVDDCDEVAERAIALGGDVAVEPYDMPGMGRAAVLGDPHGAVFTVLVPEMKSFKGLAMAGDMRASTGSLGPEFGPAETSSTEPQKTPK
jgi:uncharacterized protein